MNICVYGASSDKIKKEFIKTGEELGRRLVERGHQLVYGAGGKGMMGAVARGAYEKNGHIIGVVPRFFNADGVLFDKCTELIRTNTMRERKQIMEDSSDAFITTPGGIGTFEEFFEILTLKQLARTNKPICIFDIDGYYDELLSLMHHAIEENFMKEECTELYKVFTEIDPMLDYIENYDPDDVNLLEMKDIHEEKEIKNV